MVQLLPMLILMVTVMNAMLYVQRLLELVLQRYIFQRKYRNLTMVDRLALLEKGVCPDAPLHGCSDMRMNFALDWALLRPALRLAMLCMQHKTHAMHILDVDW